MTSIEQYVGYFLIINSLMGFTLLIKSQLIIDKYPNDMSLDIQLYEESKKDIIALFSLLFLYVMRFEFMLILCIIVIPCMILCTIITSSYIFLNTIIKILHPTNIYNYMCSSRRNEARRINQLNNNFNEINIEIGINNSVKKVVMPLQ